VAPGNTPAAYLAQRGIPENSAKGSLNSPKGQINLLKLILVVEDGRLAEFLENLLEPFDLLLSFFEMGAKGRR
jgi:hypothetical protein